MSDLIERSDAIEALHGEVQITGKENAMAVQHLIGRFTFNIANIPSVDVIEPKRGEWIDFKNGWKCNACKKWSSERSNFCPNCGARMKGADDE